MQATGLKRLTLMGLTVLGMATSASLAAPPAAVHAGDLELVRRSAATQVADLDLAGQSRGGSGQALDPASVRRISASVQAAVQRGSSQPPLVDAYPGGSAAGTGQGAGSVRPAVGDPLGTRAEIVEEVLWYRSNFLGFGDQGKLGELGCSLSTAQRKRELNALAARYEYTNQVGLTEVEICTGLFTVRR
ncbi:MAG TPA: hypothetical protein VK066_08390 [Chloroflexota bacterium]|nr:hypothetical protein [Chloroflexota bacterium]